MNAQDFVAESLRWISGLRRKLAKTYVETPHAYLSRSTATGSSDSTAMVAFEFDRENVGNGRLLEPRELAERQEVLARGRLDEEPEGVRRDRLHFNG